MNLIQKSSFTATVVALSLSSRPEPMTQPQHPVVQMITKVDSFGFVTSVPLHPAPEEEKREKDRHGSSKRRRSRSRERRSRTRSRDRDRDRRSRSRGRGSSKRRRSKSPEAKKEVEVEIPAEWKELPNRFGNWTFFAPMPCAFSFFKRRWRG